MRPISFSILFFLWTSIGFTQGGPITIFGKIENNTAKKVVLESNETGEQYEILIDDKNEAKGTIDIKAGGSYIMRIGEEYTNVFLKPMHSLRFTIDLKQFDESISYTGQLAYENNALAKLLLLDEAFAQNMQSNFKLKESDFKKKLFEHLSAKRRLLDNSHIDGELKRIEIDKLNIEQAKYLFMYPEYYRHFSKEEAYLPSADFYSFVPQLDFSQANLYKRENMSVVDGYLTYYAKINNPSSESPSLKEKLAVLNEKITNKELADAYIEDNYDNELAFSSNVKEDANLFINSTKNQALRAKINEFLRAADKLAEGKDAPLFKALDINGKTKSLSDFRGKYVYIDVWATWCGPCKAELPHYEKLKADYAGKDIQFVSVCVWDDESKWKKFLGDKKLSGNQLFIAGRENDFVKDYMIRGVPTFLLMDRQGRMISRQAERPSEEAIRTRLDGLLK